MAKKLLCVILLALSLVCVLASCDNTDSNGNTSNTPENSAHTHTYGEWETTKSSTCTTEGTKERYCSCGEKQTATIAKSEHNYSEWETTKEATFAENGEKKRSCKCGVEESEVIKFSSGTVSKEDFTEYLALSCVKALENNRLKFTWFYDDFCELIMQRDSSNGVSKYYTSDFAHQYYEHWYTNEIGYIKVSKNHTEHYYSILAQSEFEQQTESLASKLNSLFNTGSSSLFAYLTTSETTSITATSEGNKIKFDLKYADSSMPEVTIIFENGFITELTQPNATYKFDYSEALEIPDINKLPQK